MYLHVMLVKQLRYHSLYNCVPFILSSIKIVCMTYELLLWDFCIFCNRLEELNIIVQD